MQVVKLSSSVSYTSRFRVLLFSAAFTIFLTICLSLYKLLGISNPLKALPRLTVAHFKPTLGDDGYVGICLVARDVHRDLPEFLIHHYHHLDIRSIYVIDEGSNPPLSTIEDYGIPRDVVTFVYHDRAEVDARQPVESGQTEGERMKEVLFPGYDECVEKFGSRHTWLAYLDVDEFLEMTGQGLSLKDFLQSFETSESPLVGAVGVNFLTHNSNYHEEYPVSTARKAYTSCVVDVDKISGNVTDNKHIKSIVRTSLYGHAVTDHSFNTTLGSVTVGEDWDVVPWIFRTPVTRKKIALHHYPLKSKEDFWDKVRSGYVEEPKAFPVMDDYWKHINNLPRVKCEEMMKYDP